MSSTSSASIPYDTAVETLAAKLQGSLVRPTDPDYDEARAVWNGIIDRRPNLIVRCENNQDVALAIQFARENDLVLSVRGGGHNVAGLSVNDDGLVIDLSRLNSVQVDPEASTVRAGGGVLLGDLDRETQKHGLAVPVGVVSETGVAGLVLGGGYGHMRNMYGLTCDNLLEAEVVLADGRVVTASDSENQDLLWGLKGGGGNFGVVTQFTFRAHPLGPEVYFAAAFHDGHHMKETLQFYREYCSKAPNEVSSLAVCGAFPPDELFPEELHGEPFVLLLALHCGSASEAKKATEPLRTFRKPLLDFSSHMPYVEVQQFFDEDYPAGELRYYWKSLNLTSLPDEAIDIIVEHAQEQPSILSTTDLWHVGGAVAAVDEDSTAFVGRKAGFLLNPEANWEKAADDDANIKWVRTMLSAMEPYSDGSRYLNFAGFQEEGDDMMRATFAGKYERLASLKRKYDPENIFSLNQNIRPAD